MHLSLFIRIMVYPVNLVGRIESVASVATDWLIR